MSKLKEMKGKKVVTKYPLKNNYGDKIPVAVICTIKAINKKSATLEYHCECCGSYVSIAGVEPELYVMVPL